MKHVECRPTFQLSGNTPKLKLQTDIYKLQYTSNLCTLLYDCNNLVWKQNVHKTNIDSAKFGRSAQKMVRPDKLYRFQCLCIYLQQLYRSKVFDEVPYSHAVHRVSVETSNNSEPKEFEKISDKGRGIITF